MDKDCTTRLIEPLKIIFKGYGWYIYGFCRKRNDFRFFKFTRINDIKLLDENFARDIPSDILYESDYTCKEDIEVSIKIEKNMAFRVYDEFNKKNIQIGDDGSFYTTFSANYKHWLYEYLMYYGESIEVIKPDYIRAEIADKYKYILAKYEKN